jgi:DNA-binding MarR family transcriptional regulator
MIEDSLYPLLLRLNRRLSRELNSQLREVELTGEQAVMLDAIERDPAPKVTDLCLALSIDASTVSANLKPLMARSLVTSIADCADARARRLYLTQDERRRLAVAQQVLRDLDLEITGKLKDCGVVDDPTSALRILSQPP